MFSVTSVTKKYTHMQYIKQYLNLFFRPYYHSQNRKRRTYMAQKRTRFSSLALLQTTALAQAAKLGYYSRTNIRTVICDSMRAYMLRIKY